MASMTARVKFPTSPTSGLRPASGHAGNQLRRRSAPNPDRPAARVPASALVLDNLLPRLLAVVAAVLRLPPRLANAGSVRAPFPADLRFHVGPSSHSMPA